MNPESQKLEQPQECESFNPKVELERVKLESNKQVKREKLEEYKKELIKQKQGIAEIQIDLEKQIRENPDLDQEELMKTVFAKASEHRLCKDQLDLFDETLDKYVEKHQAIREAREKYPDDKELFKACFGKKPEGKIKVIETPITIYFKCHNINDYTWIREKKFFKPENEKKITKPEIKSAKRTGGRTVYNCLIPSLKNIITVENAIGIVNRIFPGIRTKATLKHEEQHIINKLFKEQLLLNHAAEEFITKKSPEHLMGYLRFLRRNEHEARVKSEILAFYKEGDYTFEQIKLILLKSKEKDGLYDYFKEDKKDIIRKLLDKLEPFVYNKNKKTINKAFELIFVDEYKQEVIKAINAIKKLENIKKSRSEIIPLLITEPLSQWDKLVKRMKETIT